MSDRGARRGAGAPFYAPLRRKTSAEIISEARAALYGEMSGSASSGSGISGALRPLRTRRPFTPREPQRALYAERGRKTTRPPSGFDLKYLSVSESNEEPLATMEARIASLDDDSLNEILETQNFKKKPVVRIPSRAPPVVGDRTVEMWGGFTKLPHLSGRSKPLHRRNTTGQGLSEESKNELSLAQTISITRPLAELDNTASNTHQDTFNSKSLSPEGSGKRRQFVVHKSASCDSAVLGDIPVRHIAVQLPNTAAEHFEDMTVLELAEALSPRSHDDHRTLLLLEALNAAVQKSVPGSSLRELVVRALYPYTDCEDERILVAVARAMLTMRVTGYHLAAACKLVFKIAKNDKNDHFFRNTNLLELLVEGCGRAEPVSESECCVFGAAALRVLALEPGLAERALRAGAAHLAALHLKILNNAKAEHPRSLDEQYTHALFQVTGALRSLASCIDGHAQEFLASGALPELVAALSLHTDRDVLTNVARCLSVVSGSESCCAQLVRVQCACGALVRALAACAPRAALAVRLAYTLGNMAAADARARNDIYNEDGAIDVLLMILETYTKRSTQRNRESDVDPDLHLVGTDLGGSDGSDEDVLIKTVRVIANLCLSDRAGRGLAATYAERTIKALLACLEVAERAIQDAGKSEEEHVSALERGEELATAALATLNNMTFYREPPDPPEDLHVPFDDICKATCRWLQGSGGEVSVAGSEAVRALGNMSRAPRTAHLIVLQGALAHLEPFLHHGVTGSRSPDFSWPKSPRLPDLRYFIKAESSSVHAPYTGEPSVRCAAAGVLVNVCGAGATGAAATLAARALAAAAARHDAAPAPLLARALWNAHAHAHAPLSSLHAHRVAEALSVFIDDESVFAACEAAKLGDRQFSDPMLTKEHVTYDAENNNYTDCDPSCYSSRRPEAGEVPGEDLGFEDGEAEECHCGPCARLAAWDELVGVAIPLLERLRPARTDASVGTD